VSANPAAGIATVAGAAALAREAVVGGTDV